MGGEAMNRMANILFDAAFGEESWPRALNQLANSFGGFESHFMIWDRARSQVDFSAWAEFGDQETQDYSRCEALICARRGEIILTQKLPDKVFLQDQIYIDFLRPLGTRYIMGLKLAESGSKLAMLRIHRRARSGPYSDAEARKLRLSFPSFSRAAQIHVERLQLQQASAMDAACLEQLKIGTIVIDRSERVLHANCVAREALDRGDALTIRNGRLVLNPDGANCALQAAMDEIKSLRDPCSRGVDQASRQLQAGPYDLTISPLTDEDSLLFRLPSSEAFLVTLRKPGRPSNDVCFQLKYAFDLTSSEAAIAEQIVRGRTLRQIATENSITINTVKTHLKAVFAKMEVGSQTDLIRMILGGDHSVRSTPRSSIGKIRDS